MIAFIIPIHPKHYGYLYNLKNRLIQVGNPFHIYLVFSNENDMNSFSLGTVFKPLIVDNQNVGNIVTYKKFYALNQLKENKDYDYFIVCDAEIDIIPSNFNQQNVLSKIENIFLNKLIYAGMNSSDNPTITKITETSSRCFKSNLDVEKLREITLNFKLYYWWSDLPVYKREHLNEFFEKIDSSSLNWFHFDHKIYLNYLCLYKEFKIINLSSLIKMGFCLEGYNTNDDNDLKILSNNLYGYSYIIRKFYNDHKEFCDKNGSFLLYHLDRE